MNDESIQLQNQVAEELDAQNDTLNRIDRNLDRTDANLQKSGKTIKAIRRPFWTAVKSMFFTEKPEDKDPHPEEERKVNGDLWDDKQVVGKGEGREGTAGTPHHVDPRGLVTKQDEQLEGRAARSTVERPPKDSLNPTAQRGLMGPNSMPPLADFGSSAAQRGHIGP